jgi:hypothetical protein
MKGASDYAPGDQPWEAALFYDDGDDPIAGAGPAGYFDTREEAVAAGRSWLAEQNDDPEGWYVSICQGEIQDEIGDGRPFDYGFNPTGGWKTLR